MSHARIQSQIVAEGSNEENIKTGEILLKEALKYYTKAKKYYENPLSNETHAKFVIKKALLFFKAAENMGNIKAKEWFQEAKTYYNTKSITDDEYVVISDEPDTLKKPEKDSEFISAVLYKDCQINFISNWVKSPTCRIEIPTEMHTPIIQLS